MKNRIISVIVNVFLCLVVGCVCVVGFATGGDRQVASGGESVYYSAKNANGVSLMFNVYENTENVYKILDILDEYSAKATFFMGGCWADDNIDCVREVAKRGHEVGSHGYFHK
ncbi:MAG: polysaccharide deacetylase family protein, partial [Candidatus Coproplasma sp.]